MSDTMRQAARQSVSLPRRRVQVTVLERLCHLIWSVPDRRGDSARRVSQEERADAWIHFSCPLTRAGI